MNPDAHETIAKQLDAEAAWHEAQAGQLRREAALSRTSAKLAAFYVHVASQLPKAP